MVKIEPHFNNELNNFLNSRNSINTAKSHLVIIKECLKYINKPIYEIRKSDIKKFITEVIDKKISKIGKNKGKPIPTKTKKLYCTFLKSFFNYIEYHSDETLNFKNPVPSIQFIQLSKQKVCEEPEQYCHSIDEIKEILKLSKGKKFRDFIFFSILITTGCRVSECVTIKIEKINFTERTIKMGFTKDHTKSNKVLIFFIPKNFISYLKNFILLTGRNPEKDKGWLFQTKNGSHLPVPTIRASTRRRYGYKYQLFHGYRRALISNRINLGCLAHISEILTNHTPNTTQFKHYYKRSLKEKREDYDNWFPYYDLLYF